MSHQTSETLPPSPEISLLGEFIHELNIARRNLSLYPPNHPQITSSAMATLMVLLQLFNQRSRITLGVSPDTLYFENGWLDKNNPVFSQFARFLYGLGVAAVSFRKGVSAEELTRFNQVLRSDRETIESCGGFTTLLHLQQIDHVEITPIDYNAFQAGQLSSISNRNLWEDFLHGLLHGLLDLDGVEAGDLDRFDPQDIAGMLNQRLQGREQELDNQQQVIGTFVTRLARIDSLEGSEFQPGEQLGKLISHLSPELRRRFLESTYEALDSAEDGAEEVLGNFPSELLLDSLEQHGRARLNIPARLVNLVGRLSNQPLSPDAHRVKGGDEAMETEVMRARLEVLFNEENQDRYMPGSYQGALKNILDVELTETIHEEEREQLKNSLAQQPVERQCCDIIFEMLYEKLDPDIEMALQNNLVELSQFFLDTGDFKALRDIHGNWSDFLYSDRTNTSIFNEKVLTSQTQQMFMSEVLDGFNLWGKDKFIDIHDYIAQVGEPYTELLIERLGQEPKMAMRRSLMKLLEGIGTDAHRLIIRSLGDQRWYLVRNLLIVLGQNIELSSMKAIQQLTDHPHPKVRQEVLRILFQHNPPTANRLLLRELASQDPESLQAAIQIAELSRDDAVLQILHRMLQAELHGDSELPRKKLLLNTLAKIGRRESLAVIRKLLQKKGLLLSRRQKELQQATIRALGYFPREIAEPLLKEVAEGAQRHQAKVAEEQLKHLSGGVHEHD